MKTGTASLQWEKVHVFISSTFNDMHAERDYNKNAVRVCLRRIDDCRPFLLCFLGQRRGWVPKEGKVSDETFAAFPDLRPVVGKASVTVMRRISLILIGNSADTGRSRWLSA